MNKEERKFVGEVISNVANNFQPLLCSNARYRGSGTKYVMDIRLTWSAPGGINSFHSVKIPCILYIYMLQEALSGVAL